MPLAHHGDCMNDYYRRVVCCKSTNSFSNMQLSELQKYLQSLPERIKKEAAHIVAETATEYFKDSFRRKAFDGRPWPQGRPKRKGSLLVASGALMNSIRPSHVSEDRVVISAGNQKVNYAQAHNEGFVGNVNVRAHQRTVKSRSGKGKTKTNGTRIVQVRAHQRTMRVPARPFMGDSKELNILIKKRIEGYINSLNQH